MKFTTNNKPREVIYGYQLTEKEYQDFDYLGEYGSDDMCMAQFIRYKGEVYYLGDFVRIVQPGDPDYHFAHINWNNKYGDWEAILAETFFSGLVIKWVDDNYETVVVGSMSC